MFALLNKSWVFGCEYIYTYATATARFTNLEYPLLSSTVISAGAILAAQNYSISAFQSVNC